MVRFGGLKLGRVMIGKGDKKNELHNALFFFFIFKSEKSPSST